jgi:cell shape-determining protein MreD
MKIFETIKKILFNNLIIIVFYYLSFNSFEGLKELPNLIIFSFILKFPDYLGLEHIFLAGIINDVVIGIPLGTSSLSYLILSFFTSYIRNATLRSKMTSEWTTFIPALFFANLVYFMIINNFSNLSFYYVELLRSSFFTFLFFPIFYVIFNTYQRIFLKNKE